jgi:hypothetical protein
MYTILINQTKFIVKAESAEKARLKVCEILDIQIGELNKMNPEVFES